jgi:hypothetical protein
MEDIKGWLMLVMSLGIIAVAVQGLFRGWLPNGPKGFEQGEGVSRDSNPIGFWFFFVLYLAFGGYAMVYAIGVLSASP